MTDAGNDLILFAQIVCDFGAFGGRFYDDQILCVGVFEFLLGGVFVSETATVASSVASSKCFVITKRGHLYVIMFCGFYSG